VINSARGEEFVALRGRGATLNDRPIHVSAVSELRLALIGTGFPFKRTEWLPQYLETLGVVLAATSGVRRGGAAALDLCHVACGRLDAFWEHWLMPWDVAAGALIVREAGGSFAGLSVGPESSLAEPSRGGAEASAVFSGAGTSLNPGPGAFRAGNGLIDEAFADLLGSTLGRTAATPAR
jgi:fructose-1,6-bisphosphatase/inositol monophosphatase family enzyme